MTRFLLSRPPRFHSVSFLLYDIASPWTWCYDVNESHLAIRISKSIVWALDKTRYRKPGIDCLARAFGEAVDQNQCLIFWSDFNLPSGRQVWFWWSSHLIVILVVEVLHEDATGEPFDPPLHPHLVLVKVLVADVVLCCRLRETSCFYHFFSHYTQLSCFFGSFKSAIYLPLALFFQAVFDTLPLVSLKYYLVA